MFHKTTKIAAAITIGLIATSQSQAKDGFSLGLLASNATVGHTIERNTGSNATPSITSRTEESDLAYGLSVGYQFHLTDDFFLGADLFYQEQNIDSRNINNLLITELSFNESYGLKVKAGVDVNEKLSVYALLGQTTLDFDIRNSYPFAPPVRTGNTDVDEITFGIGAEYNLSDHWSLVAEYSQFNDVAFSPLPEVAVPGKINDNEIDLNALTFGVNYNF